MDIYRDYLAKDSESHYVMVEQATAVAAIVIAVILAPFLGVESAFQTIQEYTGFIAPGIVSVFAGHVLAALQCGRRFCHADCLGAGQYRHENRRAGYGFCHPDLDCFPRLSGGGFCGFNPHRTAGRVQVVDTLASALTARCSTGWRLPWPSC